MPRSVRILSSLGPWPAGRKHQLRLHCARALAAPLVGDTKHGGPPVCEQLDTRDSILHISERDLVFNQKLAAPTFPDNK